jgi:hypothetical protein
MRVLRAFVLCVLGASVVAANEHAESQHRDRRSLHRRAPPLADNYSPFALNSREKRIAIFFGELGFKLGQCLCALVPPVS